MKLLLNLLLTMSVLISASISAHPGGHGEVRLELGDKQALDIVRSMTKALTFKDRGYSVGKLDVSWANVTKKEFMLVDESSSTFIYKATNAKNNQTLFFNINKNGRVQSVKDATVPEQDHGHQH